MKLGKKNNNVNRGNLSKIRAIKTKEVLLQSGNNIFFNGIMVGEAYNMKIKYFFLIFYLNMISKLLSRCRQQLQAIVGYKNIIFKL